MSDPYFNSRSFAATSGAGYPGQQQYGGRHDQQQDGGRGRAHQGGRGRRRSFDRGGSSGRSGQSRGGFHGGRGGMRGRRPGHQQSNTRNRDARRPSGYGRSRVAPGCKYFKPSFIEDPWDFERRMTSNAGEPSVVAGSEGPANEFDAAEDVVQSEASSLDEDME